jgi:nitroreductase
METALEITPQAALDLIRQRRSFGLKELKPDPVPLHLVEALLDAAQWAPNHGHTEPWRFTVYTREGRGGLGEAFAESYALVTSPAKFDAAAQEAQRNRVWQAPVWISLGLAPGSNPKIPEIEEVLALGAAVQNMFLLATAQGLASKWTSGAPTTHAHTAAFVGLQPPGRLLGFIYLGWPAVPWPSGQRAGLAERVRWVNE